MIPNMKECPVCGGLFRDPPSNTKRYCSAECRRSVPHPRATHGESRSRLHTIWCGMKSRCYGANTPSIKTYYRDRGIQVCPEWRASYEAFRDWAHASGYRDELELDRIDPDGSYCPENCRWATRSQQMRNTRVRNQANKTSRYRGVARTNSTAKPWRAGIWLSGTLSHIGVYKTEREAAEAYDAAAKKHYGEFANLNFPLSKQRSA